MAAKPTESLESLTVMLVESEILARMVLAEYLRDCGYKVIEASSAEDVFTVLRSDIQVHVVFAEVNLLGEGNGFALAKKARESYPGVDVILASGVANAADKAGDLCEESVLKKPYHPDEVVRRINILRERRRSSQRS